MMVLIMTMMLMTMMRVTMTAMLMMVFVILVLMNGGGNSDDCGMMLVMMRRRHTRTLSLHTILLANSQMQTLPRIPGKGRMRSMLGTCWPWTRRLAEDFM